jgi:plasmid stabilization system protein ParE
MSHVILSDQARTDISRLYDFLADFDTHTADKAIDIIIEAFTILEDMPMGCPFLPDRKDLRKLVIPFGASGYIAFYTYNEITDTSVVTKIKHQREKYNPQTV